jgi:hypothetical protein
MTNSSAQAQSPQPRELGPNVVRQLRAVDTFEIELSNGRTGQLTMPQLAQTGAFSGTVFGDEVTARRTGAGGAVAFVRYRNGRPYEAYSSVYDPRSGYWLGVAHALDAASDLATPSRSAFAFRFRRTLAAAGGAARRGMPAAPSTPPQLVDPPALSGSQAYAFGQPTDRVFPIWIDGRPRGWMRVNIAANGAVSGLMSDGPSAGAPQSIVGFYGASSGTLSLARVAPASAGQTVALEVFTGILERGALFAGEVMHLVADQTALRSAWSVGEPHAFSNLRYGGCLTVEDESMAPGARLWLNGHAMRPCEEAQASRRWGFVASSSSRHAMVNLNSGLCLAAPSQQGGNFTQEICFRDARSQVAMWGVNNPDAPNTDDYLFDEVTDVNRLTDYLGFHFRADGRCPGSRDQIAPYVVDTCGSDRGIPTNQRSLWRRH